MLLNRYLYKYPNFLNIKTVSALVRFLADKINFKKVGIGGKGTVVETIRKTDGFSLSNLTASISECHWHNYLASKLFLHMNDYLKKNNFYKDIHNVEHIDIQALKYQKTYHYKFHVDASRDHNRILSSVLFLNNDYKGGELCFKNTFDNEEFCIKPTPGMLVVWPSNLLFPHAVKPITEGTRYTIVSWAR
jgi:Rps23 Pro-64 3,4-dihydroxylase Tpa1-like proline 4-hydroxylase